MLEHSFLLVQLNPRIKWRIINKGIILNTLCCSYCFTPVCPQKRSSSHGQGPCSALVWSVVENLRGKRWEPSMPDFPSNDQNTLLWILCTQEVRFTWDPRSTHMWSKVFFTISRGWPPEAVFSSECTSWVNSSSKGTASRLVYFWHLQKRAFKNIL